MGVPAHEMPTRSEVIHDTLGATGYGHRRSHHIGKEKEGSDRATKFQAQRATDHNWGKKEN